MDEKSLNTSTCTVSVGNENFRLSNPSIDLLMAMVLCFPFSINTEWVLFKFVRLNLNLFDHFKNI